MKNNKIFLDKLSLYSLLFLIKKNNVSSILILCNKSRLHNFFSFLLRVKGIEVEIISFFQGNYWNHDGESATLYASRVSSELSFSEAFKMFQQFYQLNKVKLGRNSIELSIAKYLQLEIRYWMDRLSVISKLSEQYGSSEVLIKQPLLFNQNVINEEFKNLKISYYKSGYFSTIKLIFFYIKLKLRYLRRFIYSLKMDKKCDYPLQDQSTGPTVLSLQEDDLGADNYLRRQAYWVDDDTLTGKYKHIILQHFNASVYTASQISNQDKKKLVDRGVYIIPMYELWKYKNKFKNKEVIGKIKDIRKVLYKNLFKKYGFKEKYFSIYIMSLLSEAELMASFALKYRVKVFLYSDAYFSLCNSMMMVADFMGIKTIGCQYSNLGASNPIMMSEPDMMMVFSNLYEKIFRHNHISPKSFRCYGYLNDHLAQTNLNRSLEHRNKLSRLGVNFVISYFNESNQKGCFGLVDEKHDLKDLSAFLSLVVSHKDIGLIVKTQFLRTVPSRIFSGDELIKEALATGRYIEISHDNLNSIGRNRIYPGEVALASDICISHKYGATAGLEAAILGCRVALLDSYGMKTIFDEIYSHAEIEFTQLNKLIEAIIEYKNGNAKYSALGDWSKILHNFHHEGQNKSIKILRNQIDEYMF